jgi:glycerophosphoryl diester phosphodiesterase
VDEAYVKRQHKRGIKVIPWGVNDPGEIGRLLDFGVDGIISDYPGRLVKLMESGK